MNAASVREELGTVRNVLVLADDEPPCADLLSADRAEQTAVVLVTLSDAPDERIAAIRRTFGTPAETRVVAVGEGARSVAASAGDRGPIATVAQPSDLTTIGIRLGSALDDLSDTGLAVAVCFDSLTALLDHCELQRAFRFLHVATGQLARAGAAAHFHLDPEAHGDTAVATLRPLFDGVVRREDGEVTIRSR